MGGRGSTSGAKGGANVKKAFDPADQQQRANEWLNTKHDSYSVLQLTNEYGDIQEFETYSAKGLSEHIKDIVDVENGSLYDEYTSVYVKYKDGREFLANGERISELTKNEYGRTVETPVKSLRRTSIEIYKESNSATDILYGIGNKIYYDKEIEAWRSD